MVEEDEPVFTAEDAIRHACETRKVSMEHFRLPECIIITYQRECLEYTRQNFSAREVDWLHGDSRPLLILDFKGTSIGVFRCFIGAPAAAFVLEEMIACGARRFLEVGMAGAIQPNLNLGDILVVTEAIRDEGTSNHYFSPEVKLESNVMESIVKPKASS